VAFGKGGHIRTVPVPDWVRAELEDWLAAAAIDRGRLLVTPTVPVPAPKIDDLKQNPEFLRSREMVLLRNTRPFNVWGLLAISLPCGFTQAGLPIGLQIAGPHWAEAKVLQLAYSYEQATAWHKREPAMLSQLPGESAISLPPSP
jgi:Asp-tRNA(Asn)/Glu-tRNA(Gln) amidotransferase A subunit family amidase